ncbi:MAG: hypothetical protein CMP59_03160 [Flavobacteriales bacterium]|nr:hypothetical protein [Flavobacteriales bacterium]
MEYARIAHQLTDGHLDQESHFAYRWALIIPLALSYLVFGINDFTSALPSLIAASLVLYIITLFFKNKGWKTLALTLTLTLLSTWFLRYSGLIMTDIFVLLAFIWAIFLVWKVQSEEVNQRLYGLYLSISLFYGFQGKGTIVLILPLLLFLFIHDLIKKERLKFWMWTAIFGILFLAFYLLLIAGITGSPWTRFELIAENSYLGRCSYGTQGAEVLWNRLTSDFLWMLQIDYLLPYYLLLLPLLAYCLIRKQMKLNDPLNFSLSMAFVLLLSANFMSISLSTYNPMCLDIRHYLFLIPMMAIPTAILLFNEEMIKKLRWPLILMMLFAMGIGIALGHPDYLMQIAPAFAILLIVIQKGFGIQKLKWAWILLPVALLLKPIDMISSAQAFDYPSQRDFIIEELIKDGKSKTVVTDPVMKSLGEYYSGFKNDEIQFLSYADVSLRDTTLAVPIYYLKNQHTQGQAFYDENDLQLELQEAQKTKPIARTENGGIRIFDLAAEMELMKSAKLLDAKSFSYNGNYQPKHLIKQDPTNAENLVRLIEEYSNAYSIMIDDLDSIKGDLIVLAECKLYAKIKSPAQLVISLNDPNGNYYWEPQDVDPYLKSYSNWWKVSLEDLIEAENIRPNSQLKVFVWNPDREYLLMDDLSVEIYQTK